MKKNMPKEFKGGFSAIGTTALIVILAVLLGGGFLSINTFKSKISGNKEEKR